MSVNEKMFAIADAIRGYTGGDEKLGLDAMAVGVDDVYEAGRAKEKTACEAEHYTASMFGSGTKTLSVEVPFKPDTVMVFANSPYTEAQGSIIRVYSLDLRSCANRTAVMIYTTTAHANGANFSTVAMDEFSDYENGILTIQPPSNVSASTTWASNVRYTVTAAKFPEETAKSLVEEQIQLLPDAVPSGNSGTMQYKAARINALFTDVEWATLIETKSNWTFSLA